MISVRTCIAAVAAAIEDERWIVSPSEPSQDGRSDLGSIEKPTVVLYSDGSPGIPTIGDSESSSLSLSLMLHCVGQTAEQADWLADLIKDRLVGRDESGSWVTPLVVPESGVSAIHRRWVSTSAARRVDDSAAVCWASMSVSTIWEPA